MNKKAIAKTIGINLVLFVLLLTFCELFFGDWFGSKKINHLALIRNYKATFSIQHLYPWPQKTITYTRDQWGLRGDFQNTENISILSVGGSTTDQRYLDDKATWQSVLQNILSEKSNTPIAIGNAGVDGHSSIGHLKAFSLWFPGIPNLKPKYVIIYMGINDFFQPKPEFDEIETTRGASFSRVIKSNSAIYHMVQAILGTLVSSRVYKVQHSSIPLTNWTQTPYLSEENKRKLMASFATEAPALKARITQIIQRIQEMGAKAIVVNQPTRLFKFDADHKLVGLASTLTVNGIEANGFDLAPFWNEFNSRIFMNCQTTPNAICIDLNRELSSKLTDEDFYDPFHNTPSGAKKIGNYLAEKLHLDY